MTNEIWKDVPSAPQFRVSSEGRIMVAPHYVEMPHGGVRLYGGEPYLGVWNKKDGRFVIVNKGKTFRVAPLICEAFNGPKPFDAAVCMHVDENAANNNPTNLAWGTQKENLNAPGYLASIRQRADEAICKCCKATFAPRYPNQIFCSVACSGYYNNRSRAGLPAEVRR